MSVRVVFSCSKLPILATILPSISGSTIHTAMYTRTQKNMPRNLSFWPLKKTSVFAGWDEWKKVNKKGYDCEVSFERKKNRIRLFTENCGISISCDSQITDDMNNVFVALTGEQCAITDIRVM